MHLLYHTQKQCVSKAACQHCSFQHIQFYNSEISFKSYEISCEQQMFHLELQSHMWLCILVFLISAVVTHHEESMCICEKKKMYVCRVGRKRLTSSCSLSFTLCTESKANQSAVECCYLAYFTETVHTLLHLYTTAVQAP